MAKRSFRRNRPEVPDDEPAATATDTAAGIAPDAADADNGDREASGSASAGADGATETEGEASGLGSEEDAVAEITFHDTTGDDDDETDDVPAARPGSLLNRRRHRGTGRPPGRPPGRGRKSAAAATPRAAAAPKVDAETAKIVIALFEGMSAAQLGPDAKFNDQERKMIEPSLARILKRMTPAVAGQMAAIADPLMLGTGLLLWSLRVFAGPKTSPRPIRVADPDNGGMPRTVYPVQTPPSAPPPIHPDDYRNGVAPAPDGIADAWGDATAS